jgi:hypothetical protein
MTLVLIKKRKRKKRKEKSSNVMYLNGRCEKEKQPHTYLSEKRRAWKKA